MRILLTGASGFIGSNLSQHLASAHELFCTREPSAVVTLSDKWTTVAMDLKDSSSVEAAVQQTKPEVVIHLGAKTEVAKSFDSYEDFSRINYVGTVLLAEACLRLAPSLRQFVMASTMETYGRHSPEDGPFTEETEQKPMAPYAVAKLACEKYLAYMAEAYGFPATVLRQTNTYGRDKTDFFVMERIISQMVRGDVVRLGAPEPMRNFLYIDDLVSLYSAVIENSTAIGETFVTGPNNAISIGTLVALCAKVLSWQGQVEWHTIPTRPGEVFYLSSSAEKAKAMLGWSPKTDLETGIALTAGKWSTAGQELLNDRLTNRGEAPQCMDAMTSY